MAKGQRAYDKLDKVRRDDGLPLKSPLRQRVNESPATIKGYVVARGMPIELDSPFAHLPMALGEPLPINWVAL